MLLMPMAHTHPGHQTALGLLRAKAHVVPWLLLVGVVGLGLADLHRGSPITPGVAAARAIPDEAAATVPTPVSVDCNLRHDFVLRLIMNVKVMARTIVLPAHPPHAADPNAGARCLVHMGRR